MKLQTTTSDKRRRSGFTLAEVLAALVFMAIVIPVAVEGLKIAGRAGNVAGRKAQAARIAEGILNEQAASASLTGGNQSGTVVENGVPFSWTLQSEDWASDS